MFRRLSHYFVLFAALTYVTVKCVIFAHRWRLGVALTEADYIDLAKVPIVLFAAGVAVFFLLRDRQSGRVESPTASDVNAGHSISLREVRSRLPAVVTAAFARHPLLATLTALALLAIPVVLRAMGTADGWKGFRTADWVLIGLAEVPMLGVALLVIFKSWQWRKR